MLKNPVSATAIIQGRITPDEMLEFRNTLELQGEEIEFEYDFLPVEKVWGEYFRCKSCGLYFEWHEGVLRGGPPNDRRNACRGCYSIVNFFHKKSGKYKAMPKYTAKERQRQEAHDTWGGWYWSYWFRFIYKGMRAFYFGATENMISRERQHYVESSNPQVRDLFKSRKQAILNSTLASVKPVNFQVWGHNTLLEAYSHELELWEHYTQRDDVLVLNVNAPSGIPPIK